MNETRAIGIFFLLVSGGIITVLQIVTGRHRFHGIVEELRTEEEPLDDYLVPDVQTPPPSSQPSGVIEAPVVYPIHRPWMDVDESETLPWNESVVRFLIFAHQRGGSHFTVNLFRSEERLSVGAEEIRAGTGNLTVWSSKLQSAFRRNYKPTGTARATGFILHHNQVWCSDRRVSREEFVLCMGAFGRWAANHSVRIVHLVREAVLMIVSSDYVQRLDGGKVTAATGNQTLAEESRAFALKHPMPLTSTYLGQIDRLEFEFGAAHAALSRLAKYHYLRYESLVDHSIRFAALRSAFAFVDVHDVDNATLSRAFNFTPYEVHSPTCESRVANWSTNKAVFNATTRAACAALDVALKSASSVF